MADSPAQVFAAHLMAQFAAWGRPVWLAPGARSQALAIASAQLAEAGELDLHIRLDERSLGFSALGASVYGGPQVIITTSGTAVANLHPAVLEAHHSGLPLILLTADRPVELRGKGSNQTTNQVGIFNDAVTCIDVPAPDGGTDLAEKARSLVENAVLEAWSGKVVQLNLQFREPLSSNSPNAVEILQSLDMPVPVETTSLTEIGETSIDLSMPTVVVAGANSSEFEDEIAALGIPVLAEPTSGVRHLASTMLGYRFVLDNDKELVSKIKQVVVYGKPTLSRSVIALLKREDVQVLVRQSKMGQFAIGTNVTQIQSPLVGENGDPFWFEAWNQSQSIYSQPASGEFDRRAIVETIWNSGKEIVLGASQLIREADFYAPGNKVSAWANRGLSGIDGTIATAIGIAIQTGKPVRALLGDLTFFHDASSLAIDPQDGDLDLQIVVVNDNGGKIFSKLEVKETVSEDIFTRVFQTPQTGSISGLASAYGWEYLQVKDVAALTEALQRNSRLVIEIILD
jgi:2-succinyl-5-enolpyruvyl-6-hydroxy-3-cyclohexene-1-carboxylate synthase